MGFKLSNPEGMYAGLAALNLTADSWKVQFDGGHDTHPVAEYKHGAEGARVWLQFKVSQDGADVVVRSEWDLQHDQQMVKKDGYDTPAPVGGKKYIEPGFDGGHGTHVWLRFADTGGARNKEYRFQAPVHVNLGKLGEILKALNIIDPVHV